MRVALLVKEFPPNVIGGTETQSRRMATALQEREHEVTVYTKAYPDAPSDDQYDFEVVRVPNVRVNPFVSTLTFVVLATLLLIRDAGRYDVCQCMMIYPNGFVGLLVERLRGLPYVAWIRGGDYYFMKENRIKRWMIDRVFRDGLVLTSTEKVIADVHEEFPRANLRAIPNGITIPSDVPDGDSILYVGRLKAQKGVDRLLRAVAPLDVPVLIVGDGPERSSLEALAADLGVDATFVGAVPPTDVDEHLQKGRLFVLPSVAGEGGTPNAVLEAMAAGLPVVVTDTGGMLGAIERREIGFMVEPDDVDALRDRIQRLLDGDRSESMGRNAREYVRTHHGWDVIVDRLETVYGELTPSG
jgi:glycosyltransferase involved in cell wall biosynthesis